MKFSSKVRNAPLALAAMATTALWSLEAHADARTLGDIADTGREQVGAIGKLIVAGCFLGGLVMFGTGLMRLVKAQQSQGQQVSYMDGLWRIGVGACLCGVPFLIGVGTQSLGLGDTGVSVTSGGGASF